MIEVRGITEADFRSWFFCAEVAFGFRANDENVRMARERTEIDRALAAFDGDEIVGTAGVFSLEVTVPGNVAVPMGAVTIVTVLPTHRRRGVLTAMMRRQLDDIAARGECVAGLWASESVIYGRFGYGLAALNTTIELDRDHATFARPVDNSGRVRLMEREKASKVLPRLFDGFRAHHNGAVSRPATWWNDFFADPEWQREGASVHHYAVHEVRGKADGYVVYRLTNRWEQGLPAKKVIVVDMAAREPATTAALWQYLAGIDLVATIVAPHEPADVPLRHLLADPRRARTTRSADSLWIRLLDIPRALSERRYAADGDVVIEVTDRFRPVNDGRYALLGGPTGASCTRTRKKADLGLEVATLGAAYLGGTNLGTLARAGLVTEHTRGALARAATMFSCDPPPWCTTDF